MILSGDLAEIYGVEPKRLNQAVRRNAARFPADFMFRLTLAETRDVARLRSQIVTLDNRTADAREASRAAHARGAFAKYPPLAFTEHGAIMVATVLNSPKAVRMSVFVVRAFVRLRRQLAGHAELAKRLGAVARRVARHDRELRAVINALRGLLEAPPDDPRPTIGFVR